MLKCKLCGGKTNEIFNINLTAVPICDTCANQITYQQVKDFVLNPTKARGVEDE